MARVQFSALISGVSGKIGDVVGSRWKGIYYFRRRVIPSNPKTGKQCKQRHVLKVALLLWQSVKSWCKAPWTLAVSGYALSGYNKFMDDCIAALIPQFTEGGQGEDPTWSTCAVTVLTPYNAAYAVLLAVDAGTPGDATVVFTWTARAGAAAKNMVNGYYRKDVETAWSVLTPVLESAETCTFAGLTNDTEYEFALVGEDTDAELFCLSTNQMQTPTAA